MDRDEFKQLLKEALDQQTVELFRYVEQRIAEVKADVADLKDEVHGLYDVMDGLAKRHDDDDQERAAVSHQVDRHERWIHQLADATHTKLAAE